MTGGGTGSSRYIDAGAGNDTVTGQSSADTILGGTGADSLSGLGGADSLLGGDGNDTILGGAGDDTILGGIGADSVLGGTGNDSILGEDGNDTVFGGGGNDTILGGAGADIIYGDDNATATPTSESLNWNLAGADETNIAGGFTQTTGVMNVGVSFITTPRTGEISVESSDTVYVGAGDPFNPNSNLFLAGGGPGVDSTTNLNFSATSGSAYSDSVENVTFRINDIDMGSWQDIITINAYDADGNPVAVTISIDGNDSLTGNTITAANTADNPSDVAGSALVTIAGPVSRVEIIYANGGSATQALWVSDVHFDTIPLLPGDDSIDGGDGADTIFGEGGNDTLLGGLGADSLSGGLGDDLLYLAEGDSATGGDGDDSFVLTDLLEAGSSTITIV
ncbi:MAG TPA: calcium-binding protein, partial [Afifellaceae bacterium]|nr:calcium-binding protein [Afifellaceae bacterium]